MSENLLDELKRRSLNEPYGTLLGMKVTTVANGTALVSMTVRPELENIFGATHGGALFSLIDEAFQLACNSHGTLSVALNVSITYVAAPTQGCTLEAEAKEVHRTNRTASYLCTVSEQGGKLIATAQALAYRTGKDLKLKPH
jgi:acyl-CoA thioesterase